MAPEIPLPLLSARVARILGWSALIILTTIGTFSFPMMPATDLDPSWRMALSYYHEHGLQFGREVVFNYGPLGFLMGKTYAGVHWWPLISGQLILAIITAVTITYQASRLSGRSRLLFLIFFLVFGISYEDALHMLIITLLGFELLRRGAEPWKYSTLLIAGALSFYSQIKFTNFLLATFIMTLACSYGAWKKRRKEAGFLGLAFLTAYLVGWVLLGQKLGNLPAYFIGSLQISDGWLWSMGFPAPIEALWKGLVILLLLISYAVLHFCLNPDKPRATVNTLLLGAFVYLNWKHGFVRADGHMIGFFYCALLPIAAYPALLDDPLRFRRAHSWVFLGAMLLSLFALENVIPGMLQNMLGATQGKVWGNVGSVMHWDETRQRYRDNLNTARTTNDLYTTREIVGQSTLDVVGFEIGTAVLNRFNYQPRPVIQSYSVFNPYLDKLNFDHYASDRAPRFVLSKIETIDRRLPTMDDAHLLLMLAYRYEYIRTEKGFGLWRLKPGAFDPASVAPRHLRTQNLLINQPLAFGDLSGEPLWITVDLPSSLLGKIRSFLYKPPQVTLHLETIQGEKQDFLMPLPQGRTGFVINPLIEDVVDYMHFANGEVAKRIRSITLSIPDDQLKFFASGATVELSALTPPSSGRHFFASEIEQKLHMFQTFPISYTSLTPVSQAIIDGREVAVLHAPSQMIFELPQDARWITGKFGMMDGTYTDGGNTDGALFLIYWSNGKERTVLFQRYLDPVHNPADRGLQDFSGKLSGLTSGRIYLETKNGPNDNQSWDWSTWTNVRIE